jgi:peptidoglycan/LPS O-acetylase OafA/YrhL
LNLPESQVVTGNTRHTAPENRVFYPALDGLRAVAFLMVFFQHYYYLPWGWTGVNVFFVLSGFLITGILFDTRDDRHRARNFYVRRTLRIFPLYYGIFLVLLLFNPLLHWRWSWYWVAWPLYLGNFLRFLSPSILVFDSPIRIAADAWLKGATTHTVLYFGHFWSLCVEEQFYLIWPWVVFWVRSRKALLWVCGSAVVLVPLLRLAAEATAPGWMLQGELLYRATPFQLDSLLLGGLVALLLRGAHRETLLVVGRIVAAILVLVVAIYLAYTIHPSAVPNWHYGYHYAAWKFTWGLTFVNVLTASLVVCCLRAKGWLVQILSWSPLRWLGRISYGAYVFHEILHNYYWIFVVYLGRRFGLMAAHPFAMTILPALPCTLLIAWASFRLFESPFLELKERWTVRA